MAELEARPPPPTPAGAFSGTPTGPLAADFSLGVGADTLFRFFFFFFTAGVVGWPPDGVGGAPAGVVAVTFLVDTEEPLLRGANDALPRLTVAELEEATEGPGLASLGWRLECLAGVPPGALSRTRLRFDGFDSRPEDEASAGS